MICCGRELLLLIYCTIVNHVNLLHFKSCKRSYSCKWASQWNARWWIQEKKLQVFQCSLHVTLWGRCGPAVKDVHRQSPNRKHPSITVAAYSVAMLAVLACCKIFQLLQAVDWDGNPFQRRIDGFEASCAAKLRPNESLDAMPWRMGKKAIETSWLSAVLVLVDQWMRCRWLSSDQNWRDLNYDLLDAPAKKKNSLVALGGVWVCQYVSMFSSLELSQSCFLRFV